MRAGIREEVRYFEQSEMGHSRNGKHSFLGDASRYEKCGTDGQDPCGSRILICANSMSSHEKIENSRVCFRLRDDDLPEYSIYYASGCNAA